MKKREIHLDLLRILAIYAVIIVHSCGTGTHLLAVTDRNWQILTVIAALMTWQVPVFVMVSGRFFLDPDREVGFSKILRKSIPRLVLAFAVWDIIYQLYYVLSGTYADLNWKGVLAQTLVGPYHFWFLWMLICLYLLVPFLRVITADRKLSEYFLVLFLIGEFFACYGNQLPLIGDTIASIFTYTNFHFALGYPGYFVLGYYLYRYPVSDKVEKLFYLVGILFLLAAGGLTLWDSLRMGVNEDTFTRYLTPNVIIEAAALYTFFIKRVAKLHFSERMKNWITSLSSWSFGVYLIHALVLELFAKLCPIKAVDHPISAVLLLSLGCAAISNLLVWALKKLPWAGKVVS